MSGSLGRDLRFGNDFGGDGAMGTRPVVDDHRNAEAFAERFGDVSRGPIGGRTGTEWHDDPDRPIGKAIGRRLRCESDAGRADQKAAAARHR
jgi:hypothetical protein